MSESSMMGFNVEPGGPVNLGTRAKETLPKVANQTDYEGIKFGSEYLDPTGSVRTKHYKIDPSKPRDSYDAVPEGQPYLDPTGTLRTKPMSENVGLGTQVLFDMATGDPTNQKKILSNMWGEQNVQQDQQGFYVSVNGKRYRPNSGGGGISGALTRGAADVVSEALPTAGAVGGGAVGAASGGVMAAVDAGLGYAGGEAANRSLLALAGYGPSDLGLTKIPQDIAAGAAMEAGGRVAGKAVGNLVAGATHGVKYLAESLGLPAALRKLTGVTQEDVTKFTPLLERDVRLPARLAFPSAPILPRIETVARQYGTDPFTPSLEKYAGEELTATAEALGIPRSELGDPLGRTAAVGYEEAGQALHGRYGELLAQSNEKVNQTFAQASEEVRNKAVGEEVGRQSALVEAQRALDENQKLAKGVLDQGFQDIHGEIDRLRSGVPEEKSGDLVRALSGRIQAMRQAVSQRYQRLYTAWGDNFGYHVLDTAPVVRARDVFLKDLPEDIQRGHPSLIRSLSELSESEDGINAGQLHHIRTMLGDLADYRTLAPSFRNGQLKYFRDVIDQALETHPDPNAKRLLDTIDKNYAADVAPFKDKTVQKIVDWTEARMPPAGPQAATQIMGAGPETRGYIKGVTGENYDLPGTRVWDAVVGADLQGAMDASKTVYPGEVDGGKFVNEFLKRERDGILGDYPPETVDKFRQQAQYVNEMTNGGKNPLPVMVNKNTTFRTAMQNAYDAAQRVARLTKEDPIGAMDAEMKRLAKEHATSLRTAEEEFTTDPLGKILTNPNAIVAKSAEHIVREPQLLETAAKRFGDQSPEMKLLLRTYLKDVLTYSDLGAMSGRMPREVENLTRQQQERIFGLKADDVIKLAKTVREVMDEINRTDAGSSILASSAVTHPGSTPLPGAHLLRAFPAGVARVPISYALDFIVKGYSHPGFYKFVSGALSGTPAEQAAVKQLIRSYADMGGSLGAGAGSAIVNAPENPAP